MNARALHFNDFRYNKKRIKINWVYVFLLMWIGFFLITLFLIPTLNIYFLIGESAINAVLLCSFVYGIIGIANRKMWRKVLSIFFILLTFGILYQNSTLISNLNTNSVTNFFESETSYLSNMIKGSNYITNFVTSPVITPAPSISQPFVEVDYKIVGWFWSKNPKASLSSDYNYTCLVLNVTIINKGYSEVPLSSGSFELTTNGRTYSMISNPFLISTVYNNEFKSGYWLNQKFSHTILLNAGKESQTIWYVFGDPNFSPQPPKVWKTPFVLHYSVVFGNSIPYHEAQVVIRALG